MEPILRIRQDVRKACAQVAAVKDPDMALLFCYIAARGEGCALPEPQQLGLDENRLQKARSLLVLYGVCSDSEGPPKPRKEIQWDPGEIKEARQHDEAFSGLCQYYEGALGRMLRKSELEILYSVYSGLGMPAEVLMLLINYCAGRNRLSSRFFEQEAYRWKKDGVETYAQAEEYLAALERRHSRQGEIMSLFGIRDRKLSESEQNMVDKWISHGYDNDLIALAYDRTVLRTGGLKWAYLDSILESWKTAGYKTRSEVEQGEGKSAPVRQSTASPQAAAASANPAGRAAKRRGICPERAGIAAVRQPGGPGGPGRGTGRSAAAAGGKQPAFGPAQADPSSPGPWGGLSGTALRMPSLQGPGIHRHRNVPVFPAGLRERAGPQAERINKTVEKLAWWKGAGCPSLHQFAKNGDLCGVFCTSQGASVADWPRKAVNRLHADPCKNSKKWLWPLFRHTEKDWEFSQSFLLVC